jgi:hypothetical protein
MNKNHSIEIWSWEHSLNQQYLSDEESPHRRDILTVHYLDTHIDTIGYTQREYNLSVDRIPRDVSMVAVGIRNHDLMYQFMESLTFPVYYLDHGEDKIIIPVDRYHLDHSDFTNFFQDVQRYFQDINPNPIMTFIQYQGLHSFEPGNEIAVSNSFGPLLKSLNSLEEVEDTPPRTQVSSEMTSTSEESAWQRNAKTEIKAKKRDDRIKNRKIMCRYGYFCDNPRTCKFLHTEDQVRNYESGSKKIRKKCQPCSQDPCRFSTHPESCAYLHSGEVPLCFWCAKQHQPNCYSIVRPPKAMAGKKVSSKVDK